MSVGDYFQTQRGNTLCLLELTENDDCIFKHIEAGLILPPIPRTVAESRLINISERADEQWRGLNDLLVEVAA